MALHVKKGDTVAIISGDHKGALGKVIRVLPGEKRIVVQGHNIVKKHVRPSRRNPQGGRISIEQPIHISNVLVVNPKSLKPTRVRYRTDENGSKKRVAIDGAEINTVRRAAKRE